jgi:hypothetical protein
MERMAWNDERLDASFERIERRFDRLEERFDRLEDRVGGRIGTIRRELLATHRQFIQVSWTMLGVVVAQATVFFLTH